jgi:hypothetical protein
MNGKFEGRFEGQNVPATLATREAKVDARCEVARVRARAARVSFATNRCDATVRCMRAAITVRVCVC